MIIEIILTYLSNFGHFWATLDRVFEKFKFLKSQNSLLNIFRLIWTIIEIILTCLSNFGQF